MLEHTYELNLLCMNLLVLNFSLGLYIFSYGIHLSPLYRQLIHPWIVIAITLSYNVGLKNLIVCWKAYAKG